MTPDEFFAGKAPSQALFVAVCCAVDAAGPAEVRVSKSQIAFRRRNVFAWVWMPGQYLHRDTAPLVLKLSLRSRSASPRWKEVVETAPGRFTHHLELYDPADIDAEVRAWLQEAWMAAG
jgi:hypothetical protein